MTPVSFTVSLPNGSSHSIRCEVTAIPGGHTVAFADAAHVADLVAAHGLTNGDLDAFEAKAVEAFRLKEMARAVRSRLADEREAS